MRLVFAEAVEADAGAIAAVRTAAAQHLTARFGRGHWSSTATAMGVIRSMQRSRLVVGRSGARVVAVARLAAQKPWAIDPAYFTGCPRPLYLTDMTVAPDFQGRGIGRHCLSEVVRVARAWPGDAVRLDAYDAPAGAGSFYAKCGFAECGRVRYRDMPLIYYEMML